MIIRIHQTHTGLKSKYDIESDGFLFQGERGGLHDAQDITMQGRDTTLTGRFCLPAPQDVIPLIGVFGVEQQTRKFEVTRNGSVIGSVWKSLHGWGKSCYVIEFADGTALRCYSRCKGSFDYVSVYDGETQIALLENYLRSMEGRHDHKLYLLDACKAYAEILAWFAMYYAQHEVQGHGDMTFTYSWSYYNKKYDPSWRETHFPEENFFGKTKPFG